MTLSRKVTSLVDRTRSALSRNHDKATGTERTTSSSQETASTPPSSSTPPTTSSEAIEPPSITLTPDTDSLEAAAKKLAVYTTTSIPSTSRTTKKTTNATSKPSDGTTFTCFPELPAELRLKIWSYALCLPLTPLPAKGNRNASAGRLCWPPLLSVCRESRIEAVRYYEGVLGPMPRFFFVYNSFRRDYISRLFAQGLIKGLQKLEMEREREYRRGY